MQNFLLIGFEQLDHAFTGANKEKIDEIDFSLIDAIILPVSGTSLRWSCGYDFFK